MISGRAEIRVHAARACTAPCSRELGAAADAVPRNGGSAALGESADIPAIADAMTGILVAALARNLRRKYSNTR